MRIDLREETYEGIPAASALAMAVMEETGIRAYIDSIADYDRGQRMLSPGMAIKAMLGPVFDSRRKYALMNVGLFYHSAPTDLLFGEKVGHENLNESAFRRSLDTIFKMDREDVLWHCSEMCRTRYGFSSDILFMDAANFTWYAPPPGSAAEGAAVSAFGGNAKNGRNDLAQYSLMSVTDHNGIIRYLRPYSGNTADSVMDSDTLTYLERNSDCLKTTVIADCKLVNSRLMEKMFGMDIGFVSKCPSNFAGKVRADMIESARGRMDASAAVCGAKLYDEDAVINGRGLRFIVYTIGDGRERTLQYLREQGERDLRKTFGRFCRDKFACSHDAEKAYRDALEGLGESAYDLVPSLVATETGIRRPARGRPGKGSPDPGTQTVWTVDVQWEFSEERAAKMAKDHGMQVLVTNLPRAAGDLADIRKGASADTVLKLYLGEYRIEHTFRLMKSGIGIDRVYIHTPERENAMMFVVGMITLVSNIMDAVLKREMGWRSKTSSRLGMELTTSKVEFDRRNDRMFVRGPEGSGSELSEYADIFGLDPELLLGFKG
ncbi:MAG: IS1634 family transposase [Candidatus Methanoplasma sp.]|jgi:transposase|nr:IS1634 family transposase [Candidatus Methanoplasma sp.]